MRQLSKVQAQYDRQKRRPLFTDTLLQAHPLQERAAVPVLSGNPYHHYQAMVSVLLIDAEAVSRECMRWSSPSKWSSLVTLQNTQAPIAGMSMEMHGSQPTLGAAHQMGQERPSPHQSR